MECFLNRTTRYNMIDFVVNQITDNRFAIKIKKRKKKINGV